MRHFEIYLNNHKVFVSAEEITLISEGQTLFSNKGSEDIVHLVPREAMIIDVTKEYVFENALDKTINFIEEFYDSLDDRITNDIPIENKEDLRKEERKINELAKNLIEMKEQLKSK